MHACVCYAASVMSDSLQPHGLQLIRFLCPGDSPGKNTGVGTLSLLQGIFPTQGSNPALSHCGRILYHLSHQGSPRILEWVAYPFSSRSSNPGMEPGSPALQADSSPAEPPGKPRSRPLALPSRLHVRPPDRYSYSGLSATKLLR